MEVTGRDETTPAPGSEDAGKALLEEGKRGLREIIGGCGLQANDPWLRHVLDWIARATQCWRAVPAMIIDGLNPTTKDLIECTFERLDISLDNLKLEWTEHVKARRKASEKARPKDRASKHDPDQDKVREKDRPKDRASKRGAPKAVREVAHRLRAKMGARKKRNGYALSSGPNMLVDVDPMGFGTEAECLDALTRRFASTNVCMTMDYPTEEHVIDLVGDFVHVTPERKKALVEEWQTGTMGNGAPLHCCGSCGIRDWEMNYHRLLLSELSPLFELDEDSLERLFALSFEFEKVAARVHVSYVIYDVSHCFSQL